MHIVFLVKFTNTIFQDEYTGEIETKYKTPEVNPIGGSYLSDPFGNKKVNIIATRKLSM